MQDVIPNPITIVGTISAVTTVLKNWKNAVVANTMTIMPAVIAVALKC